MDEQVDAYLTLFGAYLVPVKLVILALTFQAIRCTSGYPPTNRKSRKKPNASGRKIDKKSKPLSEKSKRLKGLNIYVTNLPAAEIPTELIHDLYSLRWQVEIMFKTWKSIFKINKTKKVKIERLECHLYGQLIALLVTSSTMYKMRHLLYTKHQMELSEYKGLSGSQKYLTPLFQSMQKSCQNVPQLLFRLFHFLKKKWKEISSI